MLEQLERIARKEISLQDRWNDHQREKIYAKQSKVRSSLPHLETSNQ